MKKSLGLLLGCLIVASLGGLKSARLELPETNEPLLLDRDGAPLLVSYDGGLNRYDKVSISQVPKLLKSAFIYFEDRRFYKHGGVDWLARVAALYQNIKNLRVVRGASTITEQSVRIMNPRKRTVWSRWLEGIEARLLERRYPKEAILEFYLNQVPYASNRRGIKQAARFYFDRDLETLNEVEMLCLAYLVRAPSRLNPERRKDKLQADLIQHAEGMAAAGVITASELKALQSRELSLKRPKREPAPDHFVNFVKERAGSSGVHRTTLNTDLQGKIKELLEIRVSDLKEQNVHDGAVLVVENKTNEILSWVNAGSFRSGENSDQIDAVLAPRQPGSALKPFLYTLALEKGWHSETIINDGLLVQAVGNGMHRYRNYSRVHYGDVTLRQALANSLNVPAIHAVKFTGVTDFYLFLKKLGFESLTKPALFYGEGLALGNGEVSLYEIVRAYSALSNGGLKRELKYLADSPEKPGEQVFSSDSAAAIGSILSDPRARMLEFGRHGVFDFPMETAIKTGTSSDFHDVWAVGYSKDFTVGIWMGNLDRRAMRDVSGASGPGLLLRSIFRELYKFREFSALERSTKLQREASPPSSPPLSVMFPTPGLQIAMDPRVPDEYEAIGFKLSAKQDTPEIEWVIDDEINRGHIWGLKRGKHTVFARVFDREAERVIVTEKVNFYVR